MKKIKIKLKSVESKIKNKKADSCPICDQHMDLCVVSHKNKPFVDNKCYPKICFTCYCVPKVFEQKYDEKGYIKEEISLEYSIKNLHKPDDIFAQGSAETIEQAKKSYRAVRKLSIGKEIKNKSKPKLECYINE